MLLKFTSEQQRSAFLKRLHREAPDLVPFVRKSFAQPTILRVRETDGTVAPRFRSFVNQVQPAKVFDDVPFKTMGIGA